MNKLKLSYCINAGMLVFGVATAVTGVLKLRALGLAGSVFLPMGLLSEIHDLAGALFAALILVHIILHATWYAEMTKRLILKRTQ